MFRERFGDISKVSIESRPRYSSALSFADFPSKASKIVKEVPRGTSFKKSDLSLLHIYFEDLKVFKYHTDELFSWENILGS